MEMEKNTSHSFIHSTTAGRTALDMSYTAGIGLAVHIYTPHHIHVYNKLTLHTYVLGETIFIIRMSCSQ